MQKKLRLMRKSESVTGVVLRFAAAGAETSQDEVVWCISRSESLQYTVGDYYTFDMRLVPPKVNEAPPRIEKKARHVYDPNTGRITSE